MQPGHILLQESLPPLAHRRVGKSHLARNLQVGLAGSYGVVILGCERPNQAKNQVLKRFKHLVSTKPSLRSTPV